MSRRIIIRPEAEADIMEAAAWYEDRERGLGLEVTSSIHAAIDRALKDPKAFPRLRESPHVRRILAQRFPYRVFYIVRTDVLVVFAVLHAARQDRHWKRRV
jgi:plasmid stabilization system protein ParE